MLWRIFECLVGLATCRHRGDLWGNVECKNERVSNHKVRMRGEKGVQQDQDVNMVHDGIYQWICNGIIYLMTYITMYDYVRGLSYSGGCG
jgi:hypothetical protein